MPKGLYSKTKKHANGGAGDRRCKPRFVLFHSPGREGLSFLGHMLKGLRPGQYDLSTKAGSGQSFRLSKTFFGVGVAEPADEAGCRRALALIEKLGVGTIRLDCTYGQDSGLLDTLVDGLNALGVEVILHPVQPVPAACRMPEPAAVEEWKGFLERTLERFSGKIAAVEIGTTINRSKWSGYRLEGFLALWDASREVIRSRAVLLIGPNVTDFEPQYNAGLLGMLARKSALPDVHSNNLFAERAIEPENFDRKILGPALACVHGFDLRKKMRLLTAIAAKHGLTRNWSTCAFWTLPRISRWLAWSEEQMADYLTRYYILCASSGSFERIYWGPLVSFREGLVDDGTFLRSDDDPSARDVVSFYHTMPGVSEGWRCRPAYDAMRTLAAELTGAVHVSARCEKPTDGLEAHRFQRGEQAIYVLWTRNGQCVRLSDCFSREDLESVEYALDRDGIRSSQASAFFGQSPVYLVWATGHEPRFQTEAAPIKNLVVARPHAGFDYYDFNTGEWRGLIRAESAENAKLLADALSPHAIASMPEKDTLREARNAIWTVEDPREPGRLLVVKKPIRMAWHKRILDRNKPSKALRSWNGTSELMRRGIHTPAVVAYFESTAEGDLMNNWFICEHFKSKLSVRSFFSQYAEGAVEVEGIAFEDFTEQLVDFVFRMHQTGIFFRDLAGGNVLVDTEKKPEIIFSLIDTARIRCLPFAMHKRRRLADLKRLVLKLDAEKQVYFMNVYLKRLGARFNLINQASFKLFALKVYLKRIKRNWRRKRSA